MKYRLARDRTRKNQGGQAMVEFALIVLIFLMTVFGIIEFARLFLVYSSVYTASREAARYGAAVGAGGIYHYQDCDGIKQTAVDSGFLSGINAADIEVYYESTPGDSADRLATCVDAATKYQPRLGDRIVVDVQVNFEPILGIVPEIPLHVTTGRTIMMDIKVDATPMPREYCSSYVHYVGSAPQTGSLPEILYREVANDSSQSHFIINSITNITWNTGTVNAKLKEIRWDGNAIWYSTSADGDSPVVNITEDYWKEYNRTLPAKTGETVVPLKLEFVFDQPVTQGGINLSFYLKMQNASIYDDYCDPVN